MTTYPESPAPLPPEQPKTNRTMIIVVVVLVLLCCCCVCGSLGAYWLWNNGDALLGISSLLRGLPAF